MAEANGDLGEKKRNIYIQDFLNHDKATYMLSQVNETVNLVTILYNPTALIIKAAWSLSLNGSCTSTVYFRNQGNKTETKEPCC